jgi:hypothetical protein
MEDIFSTMTKTIASKHPDIRRTTAEVYCSLLLDVWPSKDGILDFGIDSTRHLGALQYAVRDDGVTPEDLDDALGDGPALTDLIQPPNPFYGVKFEMAWEKIGVKVFTWVDGGNETKFPLGHVRVTSTVLESVPQEQIIEAVRRHAAGDWGVVEDKLRATNEAALKNGGTVCSFFEVLNEDGEKSHLPPLVVSTDLEMPATFVATLLDCANAARRNRGGL